jgi:hypothetical protein
MIVHVEVGRNSRLSFVRSGAKWNVYCCRRMSERDTEKQGRAARTVLVVLGCLPVQRVLALEIVSCLVPSSAACALPLPRATTGRYQNCRCEREGLSRNAEICYA